MIKGLEALDNLFGLVAFQGSFEKAQKYFDIIEEELKRLEQIDNAKPSEVLECLDKLEKCADFARELPMSNWLDLAENETQLELEILKWVDTIKQALLKPQDLEKRLKDLNIRYMDYVDKSEETIGKLEDNLTKEEQENIKLKRVLSIIKEKNVNVGWFKAVLKTKGDTYDCYLYWVVFTNQDILSQEEFELFKEVLE